MGLSTTQVGSRSKARSPVTPFISNPTTVQSMGYPWACHWILHSGPIEP